MVDRAPFKPALKAFGRSVSSARRAARLNQQQLAEAAGISDTYVGQIERGEKAATLPVILGIARALKVPVADLVAGLEAHWTEPPERTN